MKKGDSKFSKFNITLIALIVISLLVKIINLYLNRQYLTNLDITFYVAVIPIFLLPLIFIYGIIKKIRFWYVASGIWTLREFLGSLDNIIKPLELGIINNWMLYSLFASLIFLLITVISIVLYAKTYNSTKEAFK